MHGHSIRDAGAYHNFLVLMEGSAYYAGDMSEDIVSRLSRGVEAFVVRYPLFIVVFVSSALTQFLWLGYPHQVIFDEVHFGKFVNSYCCTGERFFDIHPPHAKLLIAGVAWLAGYDGTFSFRTIGRPYGNVPIAALRLVPALAGTLLPLVFFILLKQLGAYDATTLFGSMVVVFDNALKTQNRIMSLDGVMLVAIFGSLSSYLVVENYLGCTARRWQLWCVVSGALAGLAVGTKFTGLTALILVGILLMLQLWRNHASLSELKRWLHAGVLIVIAALVVYAAGWAAHFLLLPHPGPGDAWHVSKWTSPLPISFVRETYRWHRVMLDANYYLTAAHFDGSFWWEWPLMKTSVYYWQAAASAVAPSDTRVAAIYFLGNPAVWWGSGVVFVLAVGSLVHRCLRVSLARLFVGREWIPLLGYVVAYGPLTRVPRVLFLYHYLTPLLFSLLVGVLWLQQRGWFRAGTVSRQPRSFFVLLAVVVALFIFFSPLTYGFFIEPQMQSVLFWLASWR